MRKAERRADTGSYGERNEVPSSLNGVGGGASFELSLRCQGHADASN